MGDYFLFVLVVIYLAFASICDLKKREIPNWLSFSLIVFALAYRAFFSMIYKDLWFFLSGLIGLIVFVGLGYGFYYSRIFAGGDAKLLMAFGAVLPVSSLYNSIFSSLAFIFLLLFCGSVYGIIWSFCLMLKNKKKFYIEFKKQREKNKKLFYVLFIAGFILFFIPFYFSDILLIFLPIIFLVFPLLYIYAKSVEEACMVVSISTRNLTEGDWLYEKVKVNKKIIMPHWEGLSVEEIRLLRKYGKKIKIKQGIPFVPAFFFAFILLLFKDYILNLLFIFT